MSAGIFLSRFSALGNLSATSVQLPTHSQSSHTASLDRALRTYRSKEYPKELWYLLASFIVIVGVFQYGAILYARRHALSTRISDPKPIIRRISLRRIPTAAVNTFRVIAFRWTLSIGQSYTLNLVEIFLTAAYIVAIFVWALVNTTDLSGHRFSLAYWANRAGALAASQFPLITALGTKNNIISFLTGVSYDKLNYLHRMTARVIFVLSWVHTAGKLSQGLSSEELGETWLRLGLLAISAFTVLCLISLRPIRVKAYEAFFFTHFALVLIFLVSAYYHTLKPKMESYIWPSFIIWGLDRLIRVIRIIVFNHSYFSFGSSSDTLDASTALLSEHLVRLTLRRPPHFHWSPGQTAYLIMPGVSSLPFEAHPFTIASYDPKGDRESFHESTSEVQDEKALEQAKASAQSWKDLVFLISVRGGFTKRLAKIAAKNGTIKTFVDGPYGSSPDLDRFNTSVLIAGGSGVSYTLPGLLQIIQRVRDGKTVCRKVVFIWAIRNNSHIHWISETLVKALLLAPVGLTLEINIHVTDATAGTLKFDSDSVNSGSSGDLEGLTIEKSNHLPSILSMPSVKVLQGRPDLPKLLATEAKAVIGRMSVAVCGPQTMAQAARNALGVSISGPHEILNGGASVTLHIESFGYA